MSYLYTQSQTNKEDTNSTLASESNDHYDKINQRILKQKIEYAQKKVRKAIIKYNNIAEACVLVDDYIVECYEMEVQVWTNQLEQLKLQLK
jgi:hypothetical protein